MVTDLREITDPQETQKKLLKYTQCFELLENLGADNCVDPDDFSQEDVEDELFKNLEISDIWELFNEEQYDGPKPVPQADTFEYVQQPKSFDCPSEEDQLLLDQDSDLRDEEDLQFMDFDEQIKNYEDMENS